ncbi:polyhydroxybutyrate depolymerase [Micromonospora citrea]|uniref:Polyhydroxybutyrate depolymerase n=1 Tax=Micromonospora citrea TaxID=47855 RepID=A0A1C6UL71_9ACTN|nr:PHB depolymerase family esterase [Micromonospora citrea]SCL54718.1 polyhydroxybutyrate depolymerase [Micromonospora citrea]
MRRTVAVLTGLMVAAVAAACGDGHRERPGAAPVPSPSGAVERPAAGDHRLSLPHDGADRSYLLHAPPGYDPARPTALVIALHFYPGSGEGLRETTGLDAVADRENFLVAYPDGRDGGFNALICCGSADDVGFLRALTEHLVRTWRADPDRIYLTGISNGGDMSFRAAVELHGTFAAIGVVSGGYSGPRTVPDDYVPEQPVSVITFIGGQDRYAEVFTSGVRTWQRRLGCRPTPGTPPAGAAGVTRTDARCADGSDVTVYTLPDMGHSWPGARAGQLAAPDAGLVATELVWDFFAAHPRRA